MSPSFWDVGQHHCVVGVQIKLQGHEFLKTRKIGISLNCVNWRCKLHPVHILPVFDVKIWNSYLPTYLITYLLTPCSIVLLAKLTGLQLVKKFSAFYGNRSSITTFTGALHLSLSGASSIQYISPHPTI